MLIIHRIINLNLRLRRVKRGAASLRGGEAAPPAYQPPKRSSPSLSHIFTYGDWGGGRAATLGGERIKALVLLLLLFPLPFQNEKEEGAEKEEEKQIASFAGTFLPPPQRSSPPNKPTQFIII